MDVNETLARLRAGVAEALQESGAKRGDLVDELAEDFDNLDNWMCKGGFRPDPWYHATPRTLELEKRAYRLRCALREAGVQENLIRAVELGEAPPIRTEEERRQGPRGGDL